MAQRPCKPDGDLKKLWQALMPGTPMPACGVADSETTGTDQEDARKAEAKLSGPRPAR